MDPRHVSNDDRNSNDVVTVAGPRPVPAQLGADYLAVLRRADERSAELQDAGRLPRDLVDGLIDTGVFRLWVPARYGGHEADVQCLVDAIELAAYHEGSVGWCVMIGASTALNAGYLPPEHALAIYGDPRAVTGGYGRPAGTARAVEGGVMVSGEWSWGSGTSHCTWIGGGTRVVDDSGKPARLADGTVAPFVYFEPEQVELADNWQVMGLKGTGSVDYHAKEAFVPDGRWVALGAAVPLVDGPLYRFSFLGALAVGVAAVTLGLAGRAIDELVALGQKRPDGSSRSLSERPSVQSELALADADLRAARSYLSEAVATCWDRSAAGGDLADDDKRLLRSAANHAVRRCSEVVDRCYTLGGGTAVYELSTLQRVFRDTHAATQHAMVAPRMWEPLGRILFGLPTDTSQF